jgi:hypothetical protein
MRLRGNDALHAADLGIVATLRTLRARRFARRHTAELMRCVPDGMVLERLEPTVTDVVVGRACAKDRTHRVIVKLARSSRGAESLRRAGERLAALGADQRLDGWGVTRPVILGSGDLDGFPFVVESALPGVTGARLLTRNTAWKPLASLALQAVEGLHRRTCAPVRVDAQLVGRWVDGPVQAIRPLVAGSRRREGAIRELDRELTARLIDTDATAGWIHGDFAPVNVLFDPAAGTVNGIIDWELADTPQLPALDRAMFVLAAHAVSERRELGAVVAAVAKGQASETLRLSLSEAALAGGGESLDARAVTLLCWLRHVALVLTQSERYARHPVWKRYNVYQVLDALADERARID